MSPEWGQPPVVVGIDATGSADAAVDRAAAQARSTHIATGWCALASL
jgi:hypothetical protein